MTAEDITGYVYKSGVHDVSHEYLPPCVHRLLGQIHDSVGEGGVSDYLR